MDPFAFKGMRLFPLRPSKGRHFMSKFLKNQKFITLESPLVDFETLKSKIKKESDGSTTNTSKKSQRQKSANHSALVSSNKTMRRSVATQVGDGIISDSGDEKSSGRKRKINQDNLIRELLGQSKETQKTSAKKNFAKRLKNESSSSKTTTKETDFQETEEFDELVFQSVNNENDAFDLVSVSSAENKRENLNNFENKERSPRQGPSGFASAKKNQTFGEESSRNSHSNMASKESGKSIDNLATDTELISWKTPEVDNNNNMTLLAQGNHSSFKTPLARAILDKYFPVDKKPVSFDNEENILNLGQIKNRHGKFGLPKLVALPKDNLKRFERICEHIRDWNAVCKLNDALEEVAT